MPTYVIKGLRPKGNEDLDKFASDLKAALKDTGKDMKASIKKIKLVDDSVYFTVEPTSLLGKVTEAIKGSLGVEATLASSPLEAFAERYGLSPPTEQG